jgi:hypothetical protein
MIYFDSSNFSAKIFSGRVLGEHAMTIDDPARRMQAIQNSTRVAQVMISRSVVMQALTLLSIR